MAAEHTARQPEPPAQKHPTDKRGAGSSIARGVFWPAAIVIAAFVLYATVFREHAAKVISQANESIVGGLGWYYMAIVSLFVIFALWVGIGRYGDIRLGKENEKPEFGMRSWLAMLFAAGMGIGLVFWGVAEPTNFFAQPRPGTGEGQADKAEAAMVQTFLHWGIHPWAIYAVVGLAVAYAVHRKGRPVSIRWALEPLLGDRIKGRWGDAIDAIAVIGTLFGVATSLGLGVMQIAAGLDFQGWVDDGGSKTLLVVLIAGITLVATLSVVSGIGKGIKWLSNANMGVAAILLLFVLITGPTLYIFNTFVQDTGGYLQNILALSFDTGASQGDAGTDWVKGWTVFYWGWWISWAPFVGIFIARISRGRTVREFVCGVLLVPTLLTFFWFSVFGGAAIYQETVGDGGIVGAGDTVNNDYALFQLLDTLPGGAFFAGLTVLLIVMFFVTSSDSGSYVVDMLASGGDPNPPVWSRVFWACAEGAVAIALLVASGTGTEALTTLQTAAIIIALPFSVVMLGMCAATLKSFHRERQAHLEAKRRRDEARLIDEAVAAFEEGMENGSLSDGGQGQRPGEQDQRPAGKR
ncbi:BCCT family transporter [Streptomyces sp. TRM70308]|uniref:BCCT family transporter n=1 Tax=Streptomyces sp. TRM70308 TaxID=3131932 RepID=UPI003D02E4DA